MKITFSEVCIRGIKTGKCQVCGKQAKRTERFWQTLNPFNINSDKMPKSKLEILVEIESARTAWLLTPVIHEKCTVIVNGCGPAPIFGAVEMTGHVEI